jgi:hypothetical protein
VVTRLFSGWSVNVKRVIPRGNLQRVGTGSRANVHNAVGVTERIPYQGGQSRIRTPLVDIPWADPIVSHRPLCLDGAIDERDRSTANVDAGPSIVHADQQSGSPPHLLSLHSRVARSDLLQA